MEERRNLYNLKDQVNLTFDIIFLWPSLPLFVESLLKDKNTLLDISQMVSLVLTGKEEKVSFIW